MSWLFDPSPPVLSAKDLVTAFTKKRPEDLCLPQRAVVVFTPADLSALVRRSRATPVAAWQPFRRFYGTADGGAVLARSQIGGPALAALVEELAAFGVTEICMWGYCGGIGEAARPGDIILATAAVREDGVSSHYLEGNDASIASPWADDWRASAQDAGFLAGTVWTTDAIYRETAGKVARYAQEGVLGVDMETASLYAVCSHKRLRAAAFLVVSDLVRPDAWQSGFGSEELKTGARRLSDFIVRDVII
jgi:uridine phosphorylase